MYIAFFWLKGGSGVASRGLYRVHQFTKVRPNLLVMIASGTIVGVALVSSRMDPLLSPFCLVDCPRWKCLE